MKGFGGFFADLFGSENLGEFFKTMFMFFDYLF